MRRIAAQCENQGTYERKVSFGDSPNHRQGRDVDGSRSGLDMHRRVDNSLARMRRSKASFASNVRRLLGPRHRARHNHDELGAVQGVQGGAQVNGREAPLVGEQAGNAPVQICQGDGHRPPRAVTHDARPTHMRVVLAGRTEEEGVQRDERL